MSDPPPAPTRKNSITDADWAASQQKVFTNWVNMILRSKQEHINNITSDFSNGLQLINLVEALTNKKLTGTVKNPTSRLHSLNNINIALKAAAESGLKITCSAEDIVDGNLKLFMGFIWTMILKFQISLNLTDKKMAPKDALMGWSKQHLQQYPTLNLKDFHQSWQDGINFCALVHRAAPDKVSFDKLDKTNKVDNLNKAFDIAESEFGIPKLLSAEDIASRHLNKSDEQIIMTYVSMFPQVYKDKNIVEPPLSGEPNYGLEQKSPEPVPIPSPRVNSGELEQLRVKIKHQESSLSVFEETVRQKDETVEKLKENLEEKDEVVIKLKHVLEEKDETVQNLQANLDQKDGKVHKLEQDLKQKEDRVYELERILSEGKNDKEYVSSLASSLANLTSEYQTIQNNLAALQQKFVQNSRLINMFSSSMGAEGGKPPTEAPITWVFTDVQDSTPLWEKDPGLVQHSLQIHNKIVREAIKEFHGYEIRTQGDSFVMSFFNPLDAAQFCINVQKRLLDANWPFRLQELLPSTETVKDSEGVAIFRGLRVRMGIHSGTPDFCEPDATSRRMDYFGPAMNLAARIGGLPFGGQIIISSPVEQELVKAGDFKDTVNIKDLGEFRLKGVEQPQRVFELAPKDWVKREFALPAPAASESQLKADLAKIKEDNERILQEMQQLKAQLQETVQKASAVQKLIAQHRQTTEGETSDLEKEVQALIQEQQKAKAQLDGNMQGMHKLSSTMSDFDSKMKEREQEKEFMRGVATVKLRELLQQVNNELESKNKERSPEETLQLERLRDSIASQLKEDSDAFLPENIATAQANYMQEKLQFLLYKFNNPPGVAPPPVVVTHAANQITEYDVKESRRWAHWCVVFHILGLVLYFPHLISILISFYIVQQRYIYSYKNTVMILSIIELMDFTMLAALVWLYLDGEWWGWIPLIVWWGVALSVGVARILLIYYYSLTPKMISSDREDV